MENSIKISQNDRRFVLDQIIDGLVKEVYVFSRNNTPQDVLNHYDLGTYTAIAIYKYIDDSWEIAFSLFDKVDDDYEDTTKAMYDIVREVVEQKEVPFIVTNDDFHSNFFVEFNHRDLIFA